MMQMLAAGGLTPLTDGVRKSDHDNLRGYYEWEPVKKLPSNPSLISEAEGKLVKVISSLLLSLPSGHEYRIVFMRRPIQQVIASQAEMIRRQTGNSPKLAPPALQAAFESHLRSVLAWLQQRASMPALFVDYPSLIDHPLEESRKIATFLENRVDPERMAEQVDSALHRQR